MPEVTLENLARRVAELERLLHAGTPPVRKDWRSVVGISEDNEFTRQMQAEIEAAREADRQAALLEE